MHRPLDPRIVNCLFDANAFNRDGGPADANVDRMLGLQRDSKIILVMPWSVQKEIEDPRTPGHVREAALPQIFSYQVSSTSLEEDQYRQVRMILQGNAKTGKHDADARHIVEAAKYGVYFITHDDRVNRVKRAELRAVFPHLWIVTPAQFLEIYDYYAISTS